MAHHMVFPFVYINLSGEMMYIIEQRLEAQNIEADKSAKVLNDVLSTMLNRKFVSDMFQPGPLWNHGAIKALMEKIVHASIMRLGHQSFDKLYDLMVMAFKYQLFSAPSPPSLMQITLEHLDNLTPMTDDPEILLQIQYLRNLVTSNFEKLSPWTWMQIRQFLLNYLQECRTRVSIFLKKQLQSESGHFYLDLQLPLPTGTQMPALTSAESPKGPYDFTTKTADQIQHLGANLFNESRRGRRSGSFPGIHKLFVGGSDNVAEADDRQTVDCETLEVLISRATDPDLIRPDEEETLLDLYDRL